MRDGENGTRASKASSNEDLILHVVCTKKNTPAIVASVSALSLGLGVLMFLYQGDVPSDMGVVRSAFILISTLTVPHFILEHVMTYKYHNAL